MFEKDGSGIEAKTPPLKGIKGFAELKRAYEVLLSHGAYVTRADGAHVHHDAPEFIKDPMRVVQLLEARRTHRPILERMVARSRHKSEMCPPWSKDEIEGIRRIAERQRPDAYRSYGMYSGYKDISLKLDVHGTFEVRMHEGCLDYAQMSAWIKLVQRIMYQVLKEEPLPGERVDPDVFLTQLKLGRKTCDTLRSKIANVDAQPPPKWYDNGRRLSSEDKDKGARAAYPDNDYYGY